MWALAVLGAQVAAALVQILAAVVERAGLSILVAAAVELRMVLLPHQALAAPA
jgi:hypothetical protein